MVVERTCKEDRPTGAARRKPASEPLSAFRHLQAYVLLGEPGSGKTTAFEAERDELNDQVELVTARDFLIQEMTAEELEGRTLFIDGLDEIRAGTADSRRPLDRLRKRLLRLGKPRFRISCRDADWLGASDQKALKYVSGDSSVTVLRLDPLTSHDIAGLLGGQLGIGDPTEFVEQAAEKGVAGLLANPQTLELLAKAVQQGSGWPESRVETFELACQSMASEGNREHRSSNRDRVPIETLTDSAGRLCAIQLISDLAGFALDDDAEDGLHPLVDSCSQGGSRQLRAALSTRFFKSHSQQRLMPVHRQIAEFLAAKHLARIIANGRPVGRVLALMTGGDGTVVTGLRGLAAWLATLSRHSRSEILDRDPVAVGRSGDLHPYSPDEKRSLLASLLRHARCVERATAEAKAFSPLVSEETGAQIHHVLTSSGRDEIREARVGFVLRMMCHATVPTGLQQMILSTVHDDTRSPEIREIGLEAYIRASRACPRLVGDLENLLAAIKQNGVSPFNRNLCGMLLGELFPGTVGPRRVWDYLTVQAGHGPSGRYVQFWRRELSSKTRDSDLPILLDSLAARSSKLNMELEHFGLWRVALALLEKGLGLHGDGLSPVRVYEWLGIAAAAYDLTPGGRYRSIQGIRTWLEQHPEFQKQVVAIGLDRCSDDSRVCIFDYKTKKRLLRARLPADFGLWCLNRARDLVASRPRVAEHLFLQANGAVGDPDTGTGLSLELLEEAAEQHEQLATHLARSRSPVQPSRDEEGWNRAREGYIQTQERERLEWIAQVRSNETALTANRGQPAVLYGLARVYFGEHLGSGDLFGEGSLVHELGDAALAKAAMTGLRGSIERDDLPTVKQVTGLLRNQREHYLGWPLIAALEEGRSSSPDFLASIEDSRIRTCVACYHSWGPHFLKSRNYQPSWYQALLGSRPEIVTDVAVQCAAAALSSEQPVSGKFWDIADGAEVPKGIAQGAVLQLLRRFPTRCTVQQLDTLDRLLWAGVRVDAGPELLDLATTKLSRASVCIGQRIRWLGVGLICRQREFRTTVADLVEGKKAEETLVRHLAKFLVRGAEPFISGENSCGFRFQDLDCSTLESIIRWLGKYFSPVEQKGFGIVTDEFRVSLFLSNIINRLAFKPEEASTAALESLLADEILGKWNAGLSRARETQRVVRRDAEYRHPTWIQVCRTLRDGPPANAADLAAITCEALGRIAGRVRTSNANEWRQYWNEGKYGKPSEGKVEAACQDVLLRDLRAELSCHGVDVQPEAQHAARARADIEVSFNGSRVPIEVKKNSDRQLWSALRDQLIGQYTLDPATDGYGIYLVVWFGVKRQRRRSDGVRPDAPGDLHRFLAESLEEVEARKVSVRVIDVTPPDPVQTVA